MKLRIITLLLLVPPLSLAQRKPAANDGPWRLVSIHTTGSQRFSEVDIVATTGLRVGAEVTPNDMKAAADRLATLGAFEEVSYEYGPAGTGVKLDFKLADAPEFLTTTFDNFVWFTDHELTDAVRRTVPLFHGAVPTEGEMLGQVTDALQALLAERHIPGTVRFQLEAERPEAKVRSGVFLIDGIEIKIAEIKFPGASAEQAQFLAPASSRLRDLPFQRSTVRSFAELNLRPVFLQHGYLKAQFGEPQATLVGSGPASPSIAVSIPVTPGLQYRLGALRWSGNRALQTFDLDRLLHVRVGAPADLVQLQRDLEAVHAAYASRGYLREQTREVPTYDDSVQVVSYELQVNEGDQYKFGSVEIVGLDAKLRNRVRSEWSMREDDPYDPAYVKTFLRAALALLPPGAVTRVSQDINDQTRTVEVVLQFEFQQPIR
ncbi:MAG: POTRA domain-containing protein [Terriglobales bacterium]